MTDHNPGDTKVAPLRVDLIAFTQPTSMIYEYMSQDPDSRGMDHLAEFAGRACYQSFHKPNEYTRKNRDYIANILRQNHTSVLEHASATFYLTGVSRSLLAELTRHRHLSFSVQSQRFVDESSAQTVTPPASDGDEEAEKILARVDEYTKEAYDLLVELFTQRGLTRKQAREAARAALPNMTETRIVVTGNMRAWRHVLAVRMAPGADAEIQEVAHKIYDHLRRIAPAAMMGLEGDDDSED